MTTPKTKPTIVLVPGMCCVGHLIYRPLISELQALDWTADQIICIDNPSVDAATKGISLKPNGLDVDITSLRQVLNDLIEVKNRDVLLVAHSYGGAPSLSAAEGLWTHQREPRGEKGGIVKVALISSPMSLPGHTVAGDRMKWQMEHNVPLDVGETFEVDGEHYLNPTGFDAFWYNDIDPSQWKEYKLKPSPMSTVLTPIASNITPTNWRVSYLLLTEIDTGMPEQLQRDIVSTARDAGAEVEVTEMRSGHFAMISHVTEVAKWLGGMV